MGNEFLRVNRRSDHSFEMLWFMQVRQPALHALQHGAFTDAKKAVMTKFLSFCSFAQQGNYFGGAEFGGFFNEPFEAAGVFDQGNGDGEPRCSLFGKISFRDVQAAVFFVRRGYFCFSRISVSVGEHKVLALLHAQHLDDVSRCFFIQVGV